ncbi:entericidin [Chelonobacter oris]|nr:entericidin A/B family lipoprotein [Chelonobacter oris]MDH2999691.1 entericidin [Chelonobacter oris]
MKLIWALILAATMGTLTACNTVKGAGQDIQSAGEAIDNTAGDVQKKM